jgi:GntR family transcriptional regulator, galactonate operon transcriptional repressor
MQRPRLSDAIVTDLATAILAGEIEAESLLPPEPRLCQRFRVSRTVVRDAMARLQRCGLISVRQGHGTVVRPRHEWQELDPDVLEIRAATGQIGDIMPALLEIRRMVEVEAAGLAAQRRTGDDLSILREHVEAMEAVLPDVDGYNDVDIAFHNAVIDATHNELMRPMMQPINQLRRIGSRITTMRSKASIDNSMAGHHAILAAIEHQDRATAREAMAEHIAQFERDLADAFTRAPAARAEIGVTNFSPTEARAS